MRYFYLDNKQNKIYAFHPSTQKELSPEQQEYIKANIVRITKEQARKAAKDNSSKLTLMALEELNMPYGDVKLGTDHSNIIPVHSFA